MGGVAVWLVAPSVRVAPFARDYADLDLAVRKRDGRKVTPFMEREGYVPERFFNSIHGAQRLNFAHADGGWTVDVVIDALRMSHVIDLRGRLEPGRATLDLADLLLTKLQIWEINEKDLGDITCLLADRPLAECPRRWRDDRREPRPVADRRRLGAVPYPGAEPAQGRGLRARAQASAARRSTRSCRRRRCWPPSAVGGRRSAGSCAGGSGSGCAGTRPPRRSATSRRAPRGG